MEAAEAAVRHTKALARSSTLVTVVTQTRALRADAAENRQQARLDPVRPILRLLQRKSGARCAYRQKMTH